MPVPDSYEKDANLNELYPLVNNVQTVILGRYARDKDQIPFYPRDVDGNEFIDLNLGLIERNGEYVYPKTLADGKPRYRDDPNGTGANKKKIYEKVNGREYIGRGLDGNQYYATDENNDEYYPENNTPAQKANGKVRYARKINRQVIFPKDANDDEFYLMFIDPCDADTIPDRYAQEKNGNQIYPQIMLDYDLISDYVLKNTYAERDGNKCYPRDAYNNEFYIDPVTSTTGPDDLILNTYALTNDGKVILPGINGTHHIMPAKQPTVTKSDILGKLVREKTGVSPDYLTKVEASNKPNIEPKKYKYLDYSTNIYKTVTPPGIAVQIIVPFYQTWYFWVLIIVSLIIKSFAVWWFFIKSEVKVM